MSTATPYYGKAKGNGFPFCLERVNVSVFDYWSTLGGTTKANVAGLTADEKAANIGLSLQNAWRLYWMIYGASGTHTYQADGGTAQTVTNSINADDDRVEGYTLPIDRLCAVPSGFLDDPYGVTIQATDLASPGDAFVEMTAPFFGETGNADLPPGGIVRMYNGSTLNEDNFVGYGVHYKPDGELASNNANGITYQINFNEGVALIALRSYSDDDLSHYFISDTDFVYAEFQGIPFLVAAGQAGFASTTSGTTDAANFTATFYVFDNRYTITLDSIEFYNQ